jgi:hypothetical protein
MYLRHNPEKGRGKAVLIPRPMDNTVLVALIGASSSGLVAITALILNYRGFASLDGRLNLMQGDMKDLNKTMTALGIDVALLKDKAGIK